MANVFMNWVNKNMIHERKVTKTDGTVSEFYNVSFPCDESKTGYASVSVSKGQVLAAKKKDGNVNPDYRSILLGAPDKVRKVSVCTDAAAKKYDTIDMTNQTIYDKYEAARAAYKTAKATTATTTNTTTETETSAE